MVAPKKFKKVSGMLSGLKKGQLKICKFNINKLKHNCFQEDSLKVEIYFLEQLESPISAKTGIKLALCLSDF